MPLAKASDCRLHLRTSSSSLDAAREQKKGKKMSDRSFHARLFDFGVIPLEIVQRLLKVTKLAELGLH